MEGVEETISGERALAIATEAAYTDYGPGLSDFDVVGDPGKERVLDIARDEAYDRQLAAA